MLDEDFTFFTTRGQYTEAVSLNGMSKTNDQFNFFFTYSFEGDSASQSSNSHDSTSTENSKASERSRGIKAMKRNSKVRQLAYIPIAVVIADGDLHGDLDELRMSFLFPEIQTTGSGRKKDGEFIFRLHHLGQGRQLLQSAGRIWGNDVLGGPDS